MCFQATGISSAALSPRELAGRARSAFWLCNDEGDPQFPVTSNPVLLSWGSSLSHLVPSVVAEWMTNQRERRGWGGAKARLPCRAVFQPDPHLSSISPKHFLFLSRNPERPPWCSRWTSCGKVFVHTEFLIFLQTFQGDKTGGSGTRKDQSTVIAVVPDLEQSSLCGAKLPK